MSKSDRWKMSDANSEIEFEEYEGLKQELPIPVGYRILVQMPIVKEKTSGGVIIPDATKETEKNIAIIGRVVSVGDAAYQRDDHLYPWCKAGDYVLIPRYAGQKILVSGIEFRVMNDDEIMAVVPNPAIVKRA